MMLHSFEILIKFNNHFSLTLNNGTLALDNLFDFDFGSINPLLTNPSNSLFTNKSPYETCLK